MGMHPRPWAGVFGALFAAVGACGDDPDPRDPNPPAERGALAVRWTLETDDGAPTTCDARSLTDAWVSVGGEPVIVPCGEDQRVVFSDLPFGRYPVVIRLRGPTGATRAEEISNVVLEARDVQEFAHTFVFTDQVAGAGRLRLRWFIDGELPASRCDRLGATEVRIRTREGSIEELSATEPCDAGERIFENLRSGNYQLIADLTDRTGAVLNTRPTSELFVAENEQTEATISFSTEPDAVGNLRTEWTIQEDPAAGRCPLNSAVQIRITTRNPSGGETEIRTSSTACTQGALGLPNLETAPLYRVRFNLIDPLFGIVSSTVARDVELVPSRTTTVTADLILP